METNVNIKAIFFDVGGVCLTNGWDETSREKLAGEFNLNFNYTEEIHNNIYEDFDRGEITIEQYVETVYFPKGKVRDFSKQDVIQFMKNQSKSYKTTFEILAKLKQNSDYRLATINNESFALNQYRIDKFNLSFYFDYFFSSCYLHARKPDSGIFKTVLYITQLLPEHCLFIDDRIENIESARNEGFYCIHLKNIENLGEHLKKYNIKY